MADAHKSTKFRLRDPKVDSLSSSVDSVDTQYLKRASESMVSAQSMSDLTRQESEKFNKTPEQKEWILGLVSESRLFNKITLKQSENIVANFFEVNFEAGENVITKGDDADRFFVVESGEVDVFIDDRFIRTMKPNSTIGATGIMKDGARTATCTAKVDCALWCVLKKDVFRIIGAEAKLQKRRSRKDRKIRRNRSRKQRLVYKDADEFQFLLEKLQETKVFMTLEESQMQTCVKEMYLEKLKLGETLVEQGEIDDSFYVCASGTFEIIVDDNKVRESVRGHCFGSNTLVDRGPRTATVKAVTDASVWKLDKYHWKKLHLSSEKRESLGSGSSKSLLSKSETNLFKSEEDLLPNDLF